MTTSPQVSIENGLFYYVRHTDFINTSGVSYRYPNVVIFRLKDIQYLCTEIEDDMPALVIYTTHKRFVFVEGMTEIVGRIVAELPSVKVYGSM